MLFREEVLDQIRTGSVTLAFRRWRRPTVQAGGSLLTSAGQLDIRSVEPVAISRISARDARRAGYDSRQSLLRELQRRTEGRIYRIELGLLRPDPRIALRQSRLSRGADFEDLRRRLERLDSRASGGPWTTRILAALHTHPGVRAGDVCELIGQQKDQFKVNVRKLKNLGLTESLGTGYRLSARGKAFLRLRGDEFPRADATLIP